MKSLRLTRPTWRVLAHGGAGPRRSTAAQRTCLTEVLILGSNILQVGQSALDAVEAMIRHLEDSGLFNAGSGSRRQLDGVQRMDASIMEGKELRAGGVATLELVRNPIMAARLVMEETDHVLVVGQQATRLARHFGLPRIHSVKKAARQSSGKHRPLPNEKTLTLYKKMAQYGTVGAVALDQHGHLAAGASTGGVPVMLPGRVGDSPLIGSGVYADNRAGAISMTGLGEGIIRLALAKQIASAMENGRSPVQAARQSLNKLVNRIQGQAGCLVMAPDGRFAIRHVTPFMSAGHWNGKGNPIVNDKF
ncbi:MAG: isoaspartyl peptidase/L-asparaginase [Nitrospirota bacterium]|nr:MAG: isoaspartyl peptidase/L-asparaginase [Nitrospirota bacterium]